MPFLEAVEEVSEEPAVEASIEQQLGDALAASVNGLIEFDTLKPLGQWLDDEVVLEWDIKFR